MKPHLTQLSTQPAMTEREWAVDGLPVLSAQISLPRPVPPMSRAARRIDRYYELQRRSYLRYCETMLLPQVTAEHHAALRLSRPLPAVCAKLEYRVTLQQGRFWGLYTQSLEHGLPGFPRLLRRWGDTWDLTTGYPVPFQEFFPDERSWKKRLLAHAEETLQRQISAGAITCHEHWRKALRRCFNPKNYYLTEEGLTFFYPMYTLAPPTAGIPTFTLPYSALPYFSEHT